MAEYISRKSAINEFKTNGVLFVYDVDCCKAIISRLEQIPAADVRENRKGQWIVEKIDDSILGTWESFKCSRCNYKYIDLNQKQYNYCPNCGTKMKN